MKKLRRILLPLCALLLLLTPALAGAAADFAPYLVLSPGETYVLPSSGTLSDACVSDREVLSVQLLGGAVLVTAGDAGVTTLLLETTTPFGTTVYEERTVVVAEGGTYCWPCTPYSDSKDMLINRGWGVNGHKGIDVNYNKDYLTDSVAYTFAPGKVVGVFHYDRNTYGKWSGSDTYNKFNYSLAKEYPDIPGLYNTEVGGGAATRGNSVVMEHTIGGETVYSEIFHLQPGSLDFAVACLASGAELPAGTPIAVVGNTGQSRGATGIHLHFQLSTGEMDGDGWRDAFNAKSVLGKDFQSGVTSISGSIFDKVPGLPTDEILRLLRGGLN